MRAICGIDWASEWHDVRIADEHSGQLLGDNAPKIGRIVDNVETLSGEANTTLKAARERYVDGPQVTRIMNDVERTTAVVGTNIEPLVTDGRAVLGDALVHRAPGADQHEHRHQRGQPDQRDRDAVRAKPVQDVVGRDPRFRLGELHAGIGVIEPGEQRNAERQGDQGDDERRPSRRLRPAVAQHQGQCAAEDRQPDQEAKQGPGRHAIGSKGSVSAGRFRSRA